MINNQHHGRFFIGILLAALACGAHAQTSDISVQVGRFWIGVSNDAYKTVNIDYTSAAVPFFPNDYNIWGNKGSGQEGYGGMGLQFTATAWVNPDGDTEKVAVYGPVNTYMSSGDVIDSLQSYIRYPYPAQNVNFALVPLILNGSYDAARFAGHSFDQLLEGTTNHLFNVHVHRKIMAWSQMLNDNYIICDVELENAGSDTLHNFYMSMNEGDNTMQISSNRNPVLAPNEAPNLTATWMHYYGGMQGDTARVYYEYSADLTPGDSLDNMGVPIRSQGGRLGYAQLSFYTILHASHAPYVNAAGDIDDFFQPSVTYCGNITRFPNPGSDDEYGSRNYWAIRGGFSDRFPHDSLHAWPGTHHGFNTDDIGTNKFWDYTSGTQTANDQRKYSSFGPYTFAPGTKLHFVWASGVAGLDLLTARQIGLQWKNGTLADPPDIPNPTTGFLPSNFLFPPGASENDKRKDRWLSTGIDSVMKTAARAKWNYEHNYNIPEAPPPPDNITIIGHGDGVVIEWADAAAEALSSFEGYRIMRRVGRQDTSYYQQIYSTGSGDRAATHLYRDTTAKVGAEYYYYIQAKARIDAGDLNADPSARGQLLYSSRALDPDYSKINPKSKPQDDLSKIRVVPNPYNINDPLINVYGWTKQPQQIFMVNLPATVRIRIFTENGDLIKDAWHDDAVKNGTWNWDMTTMNGQYINSGVYIAVFQTPDGAVSYQKFVVVR